MPVGLVQKWFGAEFDRLHPQLRQLHASGGVLGGEVVITYGTGIARVIAARLARKLNLPPAGKNHLRVTIKEQDGLLYWGRSFNHSSNMISYFKPVGNFDHGYWVERTGPIEILLTVDIKDGGWHWRCIGLKVFGVAVPPWLAPKSIAYKTIEDGTYRFSVEFSAPIIGELISYSGRLDLEPAYDDAV